MGLFDVFKARKSDAAPAAADKALARFAKFATDKRAQNYDRMEALESLARAPSAECAAVLLKRFGFQIDPSITDQEEKEVALRGILGAGEDAIQPIRDYCVRAESLAWPLRCLKELVPAERYPHELVRLLDGFDLDYHRNTEPKTQLLSELEAHPMASASASVARFLDDAADPVRFFAVSATFAQGEPSATPALVALLVREESVRVRNRICEGLASRGWPVDEVSRAAARAAVPPGYTLGDDGIVRKR